MSKGNAPAKFSSASIQAYPIARLLSPRTCLSLHRQGFMATHLEIELKWALSSTAHAQLERELIRFIGTGRRLAQDNLFFDTQDRRLRRALLNLRIRRENDAILLTCKGKLPTGPAGAHQHQEWETWLNPSIWPQVEAGNLLATELPLPPPVLAALSGAPLVALGGFHNDRLCFDHPQHPVALLCLDRTDFGAGRIDYELEIESEHPADCSQLWQAQLNQWNIPFVQQPITKFARYLMLHGPVERSS
jgi:uncharacterized protein YjbK